MADTAFHKIDNPADRSAELLRNERIERAFARLEGVLQRRPGSARSASTSTTRIVDGLRCESCDGDHVVTTDLRPGLGGDDGGPSPSALLRAALGSCLAMGYRLRAARHGIPVDGIRVEVETTNDISGMLDPESPFPPGFVEIRYRVEIDSPAPADVVERIIDEADRLSPVLDTITRPIPTNRLSSRRVTEAGER